LYVGMKYWIQQTAVCSYMVLDTADSCL